jgi:hypothetical protein
MAFQSTVRQFPTDGIVGDQALSGPVRAKSVILKSSDPTQNAIGRAVTYVAGQDDNVIVGGAGPLIFAGILSNSKQYASLGGSGGPLSPTLILPNDLPVQATTVIPGMYVTLSTTANIGDGVAYHNTTGVLAAAPGGTPPATHTLIAGASVIRRNITSPGLAIIQLLNS